MHWYCWKILLKRTPKARKVHEMSFVSGTDLSIDAAVRRAKVGLFYFTKDIQFMDAFVQEIAKLGPFATIEEASKEKEVSLVK